MTEKDLFLRIIGGDSPGRERPAFLLPGSLVSPVRAGGGGAFSPRVAPPGAEELIRLSLEVHDRGGVENTGVPFVMRVLSGSYGGETDEGTGTAARWKERYALEEVSGFRGLLNALDGDTNRLDVVMDCIRGLSEARPDVPVIADVSGPVALASSIIHARTFLTSLSDEPAAVHELLAFLTENISQYVSRLIDCGASAIFIMEPFATAEILGPEIFEEFSLPYINDVTKTAHKAGCPVIVHICGKLKGMEAGLKSLEAECLSIDSTADIAGLKRFLTGHRLMGNISQFVLASGSRQRITEESERVLGCGVDFLSPSCGLDDSIKHESLRVVRDVLDGSVG